MTIQCRWIKETDVIDEIMPVQLCDHMEEQLNLPTLKGVQGLSEVITTNTRSGKKSWLGIVYRAKAGDKGLMINFCPFCGGHIETKL